MESMVSPHTEDKSQQPTALLSLAIPHSAVIFLTSKSECTGIHTFAIQVGAGSLGVCQVQPISGRQCNVWWPPLALELHPGPPHHYRHTVTPSPVGRVLVTGQVQGPHMRHLSSLVCLASFHCFVLAATCADSIFSSH